MNERPNRYDQSLDQHIFETKDVGRVVIDNKVVHVLAGRGRDGVLTALEIMNHEMSKLANHALDKAKAKAAGPKPLPRGAKPQLSVLIDEYEFEHVCFENHGGAVIEWACHRHNALAFAQNNARPSGATFLRLRFEYDGIARRPIQGVEQDVFIYRQRGTAARDTLPAPAPKWQHSDEQVAYGLFKIDPRVIAHVERISEVPAMVATGARSPKGEVMVQRVKEDLQEPFFRKTWERGGGGSKFGTTIPAGKQEGEWVSDAYQNMHALTRILSRNIKT